MYQIFSVVCKMGKTLVLFVFHQVNNRVINFINKCIFEDEGTDFVMISNDMNNVFEVPHYVKKIFRENVGFDFGGWSYALFLNDLYKNYDKFIFVNSSVIGPFANEKKWTDYYLDGLDDDVKLFGSTINCSIFPHVQSYIFAMGRECLDLLISKQVFTLDGLSTISFVDTIHLKEVGMSRHVVANGWNIGCRHKCYMGVNFRENVYIYGDIMYPHYRNNLWTDKELVFIKGNRG